MNLRVLRAPLAYVAWAFCVVAGLLVAYPLDPYIFGFAGLALALATGAVAALGLLFVMFSCGSSARAKLVVAVSLLVAAAAVAAAIRVLGGFKWA